MKQRKNPVNIRYRLVLLSIAIAVMNLLLPAMQMLAVRADLPAFELCSGSGIKLMAAKDTNTASHASLQHCVYCPQPGYSAHTFWPQIGQLASLPLSFIPPAQGDALPPKNTYSFRKNRDPPRV